MPSGTSLTGTDFEFSKPVTVNDEFFIVISDIPEKNETCTISFATAVFRGQGNTAYFKQRGEWKAASDYFPAGSNHTSYAGTAVGRGNHRRAASRRSHVRDILVFRLPDTDRMRCRLVPRDERA